MKTVEETSRFIRHRQHELAALLPEERQAKLAAEIRQLWRGVSPSAREELINQLDPLFPIGLGQQEVVAVSAPLPPKLELDDLLALLAKEVEELPPSEQPAIQARIAKSLRWKPATVEPAITVETLIVALEKLKWMALSKPDQVLNPEIKSFSRSDIVNLHALAARLRPPNGGVAELLRNLLPLETRNLLLGFRGAESEMNQLYYRLELELPPILEEKRIGEVMRVSEIKLSGESRLLLELKARTERQNIRLNQSLLEDAYPEAIKFQTTERELIENIVAALRPMATQPLRVETVLHLAAVALMELGCLEQLGRKVLHELNRRVFDEVHGRVIDENNSLDLLVSRFVKKGDEDGLVVDTRKRTGIVKCLLFWYGYASGFGAKPLAALHPDIFETTRTTTRPTVLMTGEVDHKASWERFSEGHRQFLEELCGRNAEEWNEDHLRGAINESIERKVTTQLAEAYDWKIKEDQT